VTANKTVTPERKIKTPMYVITAENKIATVPASQEPAAGAVHFETEQELARAVSNWPAHRLLEVWNGLDEVTPVRRFTNRSTAVRRIWQAVDKRTGTRAAQSRKAASTPRRPARKATKPKPTAAVRHGSKTEQILALLRRPSGATLEALMKATDWQCHSVRGFLIGHVGKKLGLPLKSSKRQDGQRVYSLPR
jgi:hypothetical protein